MQPTGHPGQTPCQSCASVIRVVAGIIHRVQLLNAGGTDEAARSLAELATAAAQLQEAGFALPPWDKLAEGGRPPPAFVERTPKEPLRGWQRAAAACL